jgi:inosine-uridine nucleoside N-ribohydrolase
VRLWVDTDVGSDPDDAVALLCAVAHPDVDLVGVSTVDDPEGRRARVAREFVDAPVIQGDALEPEQMPAADLDALLAIGPLTNVARLRRLGALPARIAIMGGVLTPVRHRGAEQTVEHNFGQDPAAAATVINDGSGALVCPLDVTVRLCVDEPARAHLTDADARLRRPLDDWKADGNWLCLHDPLAFLAVVGETCVTVSDRRLLVDADGAVRMSHHGASHRVVIDVDANAAVERITALVARGRR